MTEPTRTSPYVTLHAANDGTELFFHYSAVILCYKDDPEEEGGTGDTSVTLRTGSEVLDTWVRESVPEVLHLVEAASKHDTWT